MQFISRVRADAAWLWHRFGYHIVGLLFGVSVIGGAYALMVIAQTWGLLLISSLLISYVGVKAFWFAGR